MPRQLNTLETASSLSGPTAENDLARRFEVFMALADKVDMPQAERAGILGASSESLVFGAHCLHGRESEGLRRLEYAIILLERLVANMKHS